MEQCVLSNYFVNRDSNQGACVQACRWEYELSYKDNKGDTYPVKQDERGTYVFNSKDMCLINHLKKLIDAGISSFKIEGRMKTPYYVATVVNAYKRALANIYGNKKDDFDYITELQKTSHRHFSTGFYFPDEETEYTLSSKAVQSHQFVAVVKEKLNNNEALIELRNKIVIGDELEILSPTDNWNKVIKVIKLIHKDLGPLEEANRVQDLYIINDEIGLKVDDIIRKKIDD